MPFYEYEAQDVKNSCNHCEDGFEVRQSIKSKPIKKCPNCKNAVVKKVSLIASFIDSNRQMNQFGDVKHAKYWRDKNGIRHKVTSADGSRTSPTTSSQQTASPEQIKRRKEHDQKQTQKRLKRIRHKIVKKKNKSTSY